MNDVALGVLCGALVHATLGCSSPEATRVQDTGVQQRLSEVPATAKPASTRVPTLPGIEFTPGEPPPAPVTIGRDGAIVGRLTDEGQHAVLEFEAAEGELSLFELTAYGYSRGWNASSRLAVRDATGAELANQRRVGSALFGDLLAFVAPHAGSYTLEVRADEHYFRYLVVRHSSYEVQELDEVIALDEPGDETAHGWTGGNGSRMRFLVRGTPGAALALRVEPTSERGWKHKRALRSRAPAVTAGLVDARRMEQRNDPRNRDDLSFPNFTLGLAASVDPHVPLTADAGGDAAVGVGGLVAQGSFSALARLPASGFVFVEVVQANDGPGGLFDLTVERNLTLAPLAVRVGDTDDDPVVGAEVVLLREPALEFLGRATTGADGTATLQAPPGAYTVLYRAPDRGPETVRTTLAPDTPLNVVASR